MDELSVMKFEPLKTSHKSVFAYARTNGDYTIVVIGNLDFKTPVKASVKISGVNSKTKYMDMRLNRDITPVLQKGKITLDLIPGDIQVLKIKG